MNEKQKNNTPVFVFGEIMVETWSKVENLASVNTTTNIEQSYNFLGGMAANSAVALASLIGECYLITDLGENTKQFITRLENLGVSFKYCTKSPNHSSVVYAFFSKEGYQHYHLLASEPAEFYLTRQNLVAEKGIFLLTGGHYKYFRDMFVEVANQKKEHKGYVIFSPSYALYSYKKDELEKILSTSDVVVLNRKETEWTCDLFGVDERILRKMGPEIFIFTRDRDGCMLSIKSVDEMLMVPPIPVNEINSIGAGDAFNAGFIFGLVNQNDFEVCAKLGNALASICVSKPEVQIEITPQFLFDIYNSSY